MIESWSLSNYKTKSEDMQLQVDGIGQYLGGKVSYFS